MNTPSILLIYSYNYWATHRILTAAARVTPEQYTAPTTHSYVTLRGTLVHLLDAEIGWRKLFQENTTEYFDALTEPDVPTFADLQQGWQAQEQAMRAYLARLTDADLTALVRYTNSEGQLRERPLWHCLYHLANHGTQHRAEAAAVLTDYGCSPGEMDFAHFLNEQV